VRKFTALPYSKGVLKGPPKTNGAERKTLTAVDGSALKKRKRTFSILATYLMY
jgi:hypothetical protein